METYDIVVVGASFSGLTFGHYSSPKHRVLIIDRKTQLNAAIESTGLITQATKDLLGAFCDIDRFVPNHITHIGVVAPDYRQHFFSHTDTPWIYSTDTPELVKHISETLPSNVTLALGAGLLEYAIEPDQEFPVRITYFTGGQKKEARARFVVGADGSHSTVAKLSSGGLSQNARFLAAHEKVFYGDILFGDKPQNTVYHYWFGEFSLGYGGWLSPTIINGRHAFRLGLAKREKNSRELKKINEFITILQEKGMIRIDGDPSKPVVAFGHLIPIGGVLRNITTPYSMLIGDAAGFCGAFAADGIKGAVVSGKVAAEAVHTYLSGDTTALKKYPRQMEEYQSLLTYYKKQLVYRFLWDRILSDRSFTIVHSIIAREKEGFLHQFCDSKDRRKSLLSVILKVHNIPMLIRCGVSVVGDIFGV